MRINGIEFTLGADPEVFMGKDGQFVSAHDAVPGNKLKPYPVEKGAVQVDGMALEFNIDPASSYEQFQQNLDVVQQQLKGMIGDNEFLDSCSVHFEEDFLDTVPPENLVLGCEADFNGYTLSETPKPNEKALTRTAGGHVHIGGFNCNDPFNENHFNHCARLARILDETLGVYSVLWDKDDDRRSMYGQAGCFRPKTYGMEYRTLSNSWIFKPHLVKFVFDSTVEAIEKMFDKSYEPNKLVRDIINTSNRNSEFFVGNEKVKMLKV